MKTPGPPTPAHPPPDAPEKRVQETEGAVENSGLAARKRAEALEAVKRSQSNPGEQTNGEESGEEENGNEKTSSQDQRGSEKK